jgi:hypothetical protein
MLFSVFYSPWQRIKMRIVLAIELRDFMKAMTELFTKNQASTTTTSPSITSYCILPSLPSYDGFDSNKYFACEIKMDEIFWQRRICERRKLRNVANTLTNDALVWWKHLFESDELPKTLNDVKILMRKTFVDSSPTSNLNSEIHSLNEEATIASPIVHNILQEVKIKQEKEQVMNELDTSVFIHPLVLKLNIWFMVHVLRMS